MRIVIADDHPLYIEAVRGQLERVFPDAEIAASASLDGVLALLAGTTADLVMLDFSMPGMNGTEGVRRAVQATAAPVLVMSGIADERDVRACIESGARGFLPKTLEGRVFASAVGVVAAGGSFVPAEFVGASAKAQPAEEDGFRRSDFTPRELEVLNMVVAGASNKEIARRLELQEVTIKLHFSRIFQKMGVKNRSHAAVLAVRSGLVDEPA